MSASQEMVPQYASKKIEPSGAHSVPDVNNISSLSDLHFFKASSAGFVGRGWRRCLLIRLCIRAYPKYSPDLLAENNRYTSSAHSIKSNVYQWLLDGIAILQMLRSGSSRYALVSTSAHSVPILQGLLSRVFS